MRRVFVTKGILAVAALVLATLAFGENGASDKQTNDSETHDVDLNLVLGGRLLTSGGVVSLVILPRETPIQRPDKIDIPLTSRASIVYMEIGPGEKYTYRFKPAEGTGDAVTTSRFAVGGFAQGGELPDATILDHHVDVRLDWTERDSRTAVARIAVSSARERYPCIADLGIQVCDAAGGVPEWADE